MTWPDTWRANSNVDLLVAEAQRWRGTAVLHEAVGSVLALPGLKAAGVDLSGWSAWWTDTDIPAAERAVVAASVVTVRRSGRHGFGWPGRCQD